MGSETCRLKRNICGGVFGYTLRVASRFHALSIKSRTFKTTRESEKSFPLDMLFETKLSNTAMLIFYSRNSRTSDVSLGTLGSRIDGLTCYPARRGLSKLEDRDSRDSDKLSARMSLLTYTICYIHSTQTIVTNYAQTQTGPVLCSSYRCPADPDAKI